MEVKKFFSNKNHQLVPTGFTDKDHWSWNENKNLYIRDEKSKCGNDVYCTLEEALSWAVLDLIRWDKTRGE